MIIRIYTYTLPLRLSALPLNEGKQFQTNVGANFEKVLNCAANFLPFKGEMSADRGVEQ